MVKLFYVLCLAVLVFFQNSFSQSNSSGVLLYSQTDLIAGYPIRSDDFGIGAENLDCQIADDFTVDGDWAIEQIVVSGMHENDFTFETGFNIYIYSNINKMPGDLVYFGDNQPFTQNVSTGNPIIFTITLETPAILSSGDYWISIQAQMNWSKNPWEFWYWNQVSGSYNNIALYQNPGGFWPQGCLNWNIIPECWGPWGSTQSDMYFELYGLVVPVELSSFSAMVNYDNVELSWITSTETNNQGFEVQRAKDGEFETIGFVEGHGTTTKSQAYSYIDSDVVTGKYQYRLKQIDFHGTFEYSNVVEVEVISPSTFSLKQNYPNPFNPSTVISYQLPVSGDVTLKVYDVLGNEVATLINEEKSAGSYEVEFNASSLPSGTYFYQLKAGSFIEAKKMVVIK